MTICYGSETSSPNGLHNVKPDLNTNLNDPCGRGLFKLQSNIGLHQNGRENQIFNRRIQDLD